MDLSVMWAACHTAVGVYPHVHSFYQLICCKKSGGFITLGDTLYEAREQYIYLAKPNVSHGFDQCGRMEILEVKFNAFGTLAEDLNRLPDCFCPQDAAFSVQLLDKVAQEHTQRGPHFDAAARCALQLFFIEAIRQFSAAQPHAEAVQPETVQSKKSSDIQILQLKDYIEAHLHEDLTLETLAEKAHFNKTYFVHRFQQLWGVTPIKYVNNLRYQKAKLLLLDTDLPIARISAMVGFRTPHYFSAFFKGCSGISPTAFRLRGDAL